MHPLSRARTVSVRSTGIIIIDSAWLFAAARMSLSEPFSLPHFDALCLTLRGALLSDSPGTLGNSGDNGGGGCGKETVGEQYEALCGWLLEVAVDLVRPDLQRPHSNPSVLVIPHRGPSSGGRQQHPSHSTALQSLPVRQMGSVFDSTASVQSMPRLGRNIDGGELTSGTDRRMSADDSKLKMGEARRVEVGQRPGQYWDGHKEADRRFSYLIENVCK